MENEITWQALATVAGASVVAGLFVQFVKLFYSNMSAQFTRALAAIFGLIAVVGTAVLAGPVTVQGVVLAVIVGIQAGLAAAKTFELADNGLNHTVTRQG